ncbi:glycosyltransferase family 2 protein [Variovorax sp. VNK109]|jgi:glycosyltransferase involved in cell wall biosynthesis|uniref:glycosyltransferase family 2 protein n=1 Tax=Variovorax sp. VNK109 TaxID=3400919 RepID=UPI003BFAB961
MQPTVAILLATYGGERFLEQQLRSILQQTYRNWRLFASDDGSSDGTLEVLDRFASTAGQGRTHIQCGPRRGFAANFLSLACATDIAADYYAFCDQDDIWNIDKVERSLAWLRCVPEGMPALYCSRTVLVDKDNVKIGTSRLFVKPPTFANALVQNIAGGNTMMFNRAASELLRQAGAGVDAVFHDWWTYILVAGAGGYVFYDPLPSLRYRQHGANVIGAGSNLVSTLGRARALLAGQIRGWNERHIAGLQKVQHLLSEENRWALHDFARARRSAFLKRLALLQISGVYRQTALGNIGLAGAAVLNKL